MMTEPVDGKVNIHFAVQSVWIICTIIKTDQFNRLYQLKKELKQLNDYNLRSFLHC